MIGVVVSQFNPKFTDKLLENCERGLNESGIEYEVVKVPGAFEIPLMAKKMTQWCDVVIALGCVIKGETDHYEMVCRACTDGIMQVQLDTGVPIVFGVLMSKEVDYLHSRVSRGYEYAKVALEIFNSNKNEPEDSSRFES